MSRASGWWEVAAAAALAVAMAAPAAYAGQAATAAGQWPVGGQNLDNGRNQAATSINPGNAARLKPKWVFTAGSDITATPAVANGIVYFPDFAGGFYALDAATGTLIWKHKLADWTEVSGDFARDDPVVDGTLVILGDEGGETARWNGTQIEGPGAKVIAVDAKTGDKVWVSQVEDFPTAKVTSSPVVYNGVVFVGLASAEEGVAATRGAPCCRTRGSLVALNVQTGGKIWQTYLVPDNRGALDQYSGGGIWSSTPVVDAKRRAIYVGTGNNYSVPAVVAACFAQSPGKPDCADPQDHFDSVVALDLATGAVKWSRRAEAYDAWNVSCIVPAPVPKAGETVPRNNCPDPAGADYDFGGSGPNLLHVGGRDILGIGSKSGVYWALDPDDGSVLWTTQVGPGGPLGGIEWGTAADAAHIYVPIANRDGTEYALQPAGQHVTGGSWAALDPATGKIVWQTATPGTCTVPHPDAASGCMALAPVSVAGGVLFGASMATGSAEPAMFGLDASSGKILWSFNPGSSVIAGPAIDGDTVYWGSGYRHFGPSTGTPNTKLFAFTIGE